MDSEEKMAIYLRRLHNSGSPGRSIAGAQRTLCTESPAGDIASDLTPEETAHASQCPTCKSLLERCRSGERGGLREIETHGRPGTTRSFGTCLKLRHKFEQMLHGA